MTEKFMIGTYTSKTSKGIYGVTLDTDAEKLSTPWVVAETQKPSYLQVIDDKVAAVKQAGKDGGIATYQIENDHATMLDQSLAAGSPPAYVSYDAEKHLLFSANYHTGDIKVYKVDDGWKLTLTDSVHHEGATGPEPEQDSPHPHFADLTPDHRLVVCDLGMDLVVVYDLSDDGKLTAKSRYQSEAGFGSRHITFSPDGKFAYLLGELSSKLEVLKYNAENGAFAHVQTIKTIPADWTSHNGAAAIHMTKDGKFIYTSNRGENTIAVFAIQADGTVEHIQSISTEGDFPRDFELSTTEEYLVAANQNTDNLSLYKRNDQTGKLTLLQKDVPSPEPVCVKKW
ncbi:lactonase family protein [Lactobacillus alvi]|uniref:Lactonase family protein n=1 Tax=Limosilactobacillus alvi TaxID=990412 RepID=A0ABS2EM69_9LACO|nr:lactonase family protein [Limosilactobacillus alvi]MBM6753584.1 lactonase family protein [Limosilactobacillus alvi]